MALMPLCAQASPLVIAATDWAPYTDQRLKNNGFFAEICQAALAKSGYESRIEFMPWKRAVELTKSGKKEALLGASYTQERTQYFAYPKFYWENPILFFAQKGHTPSYNDVKELCPAKLGMFTGSFYEKRFKEYGCFNIETVAKTELNIKKLAAGRIQLVLDSKDSVNFSLNNETSTYKDKIISLSPPLEIDKIYLVISKKLPDYEKIRDAFDAGMDALKAEGSYDKILVKHGMK
ncbi:MAG: transporter substrate-binding domain-containing protein [Desulfobacterium sp.]|nr:transporter substrate-binding domain-containing protein [Desulfobacterium sp.]